MFENSNRETLSKQANARLILDFFHRTMMHHALWFAEVQHQLGPEKAFETLRDAWDKSSSIQMTRIAKTLGFELENGIPKPLLELPDETMEKLREALAVNWLANDGVWFQAVEFTRGMNDAKRCNDSCWGQFSPFEAWSIKRFLNLPENPGLEGLKQALNFRLYAFINEQSFSHETETSFIFQMNQCRVQNARKRKGLADYPCKSGGLVEYTTFAEAIDPRIKTECISCPPDPHPEEYFCAWRFSIEE
ncbi:MAG: cytosolic protein [Bacteroidetes bacterium]|nr:cytosolic protein [Bacteroidota bacterium]